MTTCPECGFEIDPDYCWCGLSLEKHYEEHSPVPMGCICGYPEKERIKMFKAEISRLNKELEEYVLDPRMSLTRKDLEAAYGACIAWLGDKEKGRTKIGLEVIRAAEKLPAVFLNLPEEEVLSNISHKSKG